MGKSEKMDSGLESVRFLINIRERPPILRFLGTLLPTLRKGASAVIGSLLCTMHVLRGSSFGPVAMAEFDRITDTLPMNGERVIVFQELICYDSSLL